MQMNFLKASRPAPESGNATTDADADFMFMLDGYRASGGIVRADEMPSVLRSQHGAEIKDIARWIAARHVVYLYWAGNYWLPAFQFDRHDRQPKRELRPILAQLAPAFDEWDTAVWFSRPNPWLSGEVPANLLSSHATDVEEAARADRFARRG
ncbi:antitoxin Xre/MbcA/ParS toxin-binding domain-containing protein [uncultured Ramlibacter sp.]|uniref:antitoxin Xre/MbcA/ParS toxin-binding domain-containing protein n=1 Tax=uncultured Ramlibacter sp. TaxID=260755 RepID=UPI002637D723|nr:antitoxin Xre/MbcA/ParS toxin-binding domain-containing protein [uncultured Ramlibacter sp.]